MFKYFILALVLCLKPQAATDLSLSSAVSDFQNPIGVSVTPPNSTEKQEAAKGPLFNFKTVPGFFKTIDQSHASIKRVISRGIDYLNNLVAGFDITFLLLFILYTLSFFTVLLLFILYTLSFFTVVRLSEQYSKANHRSPSFSLCASMALLLLLVNTIFYGLAEEKIRDNELEFSMKYFVFLYSFVAIGKIAISFIVGSTFHFFSPHPQANTARKVYFVGLLHSFEKIIIFVLPVLVVALQAADFIQYCFHWVERCDNTIQKIILHMVRALISGYGMLFYLSIYATYFPKFRKKVTSHPISTTLIIIILTLGFSEIFNTHGFWLNTLTINSLISNFIKTPDGPTFIGADQILRRLLRIALVVTNVILGFRIIVIINTFGPDTLWFKELSDNLYTRFVTISFITAAALLFYYKVLYAAKKISLNQEKRLEGNLYLVVPNSKFLAIINAVGDLGTIIFWPLYSYLVLIELGLNQVYLSSFYGIIVAGALLGGKSSIDDFFRGLSYILQGIIVRGGKITVNMGSNDNIFGAVEEIFLQNFYLRDREGQLHTLNYSVIKTITFHNEIYSSFILQFPGDVDINALNNLFIEEKNRFNKEQDDKIETISIFNIFKNDDDQIEISYLIKGKPIKIWGAQALFEKRLGQILKKKKIQYTLVHGPSSS
ncbi:MAG: hypothetical protein C0582_05850 [Alphaproteobacteria bacterium]|nr:MAG: hypothetical protein C0582_05850 [Alphaproteobacteria bacterium]